MFIIGKTIQDLRLRSHFTQKQVAEKLEVSENTVIGWENNRKKPTAEHLIELAVLYNSSMNEILDRKEEIIVTEGLLNKQETILKKIISAFSADNEAKGSLQKEQKVIINELMDEFIRR